MGLLPLLALTQMDVSAHQRGEFRDPARHGPLHAVPVPILNDAREVSDSGFSE
jgi:hypothetical protein